jgi:hypothetical protein
MAVYLLSGIFGFFTCYYYFEKYNSIYDSQNPVARSMKINEEDNFIYTDENLKYIPEELLDKNIFVCNITYGKENIKILIYKRSLKRTSYY